VTVIKGTWYAGTGDTFDVNKAVPLRAGSYMYHPAKAVALTVAKERGSYRRRSPALAQAQRFQQARGACHIDEEVALEIVEGVWSEVLPPRCTIAAGCGLPPGSGNRRRG